MASAAGPKKKEPPPKQPAPRLPERKDLDPHWEATSELIKTTNEDIAKGRNELIFVLGVVAFILVTTFGMDDRALLIGTRITLPVFGASIDLKSFLAGSPVLLVCLHFVLLLKFRNLREKCDAVETRLAIMRRNFPTKARSHELRVTSNFLTQWVIGRSQAGLFAWLNSLVYITCLYLAPIATLLFLILRTLPLHNEDLTLFQLGVLFIDAWLSIFVTRARRFWAATILATLFASFFAIFFSVPDSRLDQWGRDHLVSAPVPYGMPNATRRAFWLTAYFLESEVDVSTGHPIRWLSRNLVAMNAQVGPSETDPRTRVGAENGSLTWLPSIPVELRPNLSGRNLQYAILDYSNLRGANFEAADLTGASLRYADLTGADLGCPGQGIKVGDELTATAIARCTKFDHADLEGAQLVGVINHTTWHRTQNTASFADADLSSANLSGADVPFLVLDRADLSRATLFSANLVNASLVGTDLTGANLAGATLRGANATLSTFGWSALTGADFGATNLKLANFQNASLRGVDFEDSILWGASFQGANLWGAQLPSKERLWWVNFTKAYARPPMPAESEELQVAENILRTGGSFTGATTFAKLVKRLKNKTTRGGNDEKDWEAWFEALTVLDTNAEYRAAIGELITSAACRDRRATRAVANWTRPIESGITYTEERGEPLPRVDHRLDKLPDKRPFEFGDSYSEPIAQLINPVPKWYHLEQLVEALANPTTCEAAATTPPSLIASLKEQLMMQRAQSGAP